MEEMKNERLKQNVLAFMDYANGKEEDLMVTKAKLNYDIKEGITDIMTADELDEAFLFVKSNYFEIVKARKSGDFTVADKLFEAWGG